MVTSKASIADSLESPKIQYLKSSAFRSDRSLCLRPMGIKHLHRNLLKTATIIQIAKLSPTAFYSVEEISFLTNGYQKENTTVELHVQALSAKDIGSTTKFYNFRYKPNPVLYDIQPRTTFIRSAI